MRELNDLIPAPQALAMVLEGAGPTASETVSLKSAAGRVLSADLKAGRTQPPFDASAMDGYAVQADDLNSLPCSLELIGESRAGAQFDGKVSAGCAVRIFTGAVVPVGADTIVIQEDTEPGGKTVLVREGGPKGKFIRKAGLDFAKGDVLLSKGDVLDPQRLALAASMNHAAVEVFRKPKVAVIATGDELVMPGDEIGPGKIIASNTFGISALIEKSGGEVIDLGIAPDTINGLQGALEQALEAGADVIVTTGGASVGDHDLVMPVAGGIGFEFEITKIAMRPGKPFLFAKHQTHEHTTRLVGLAGNPVSSMVAGDVFVRPLVSRMAGHPDRVSAPLPALLGGDLPANDEREEYMRASLTLDGDGKRIATPYPKQDSSMLATLVKAECLIIRPANAAAAKSGEPCRVIVLR